MDILIGCQANLVWAAILSTSTYGGQQVLARKLSMSISTAGVRVEQRVLKHGTSEKRALAISTGYQLAPFSLGIY